MPADSTTQLQSWIDRMNAGDPSARDQLIGHAYERLRRLSHKMLQDYPRLRGWEGTSDVLHEAYPRLCRALQAVPFSSVREFFRLAATQLRRELLDLHRHYFGPEGVGARQVPGSAGDGSQSTPRALADRPDETNEPSRLASWSEFHRLVEALPEEEREVFELLWYQQLTQAEVAGVLNLSTVTVKRHWAKAKHTLYVAMNGELPGS